MLVVKICTLQMFIYIYIATYIVFKAYILPYTCSGKSAILVFYYICAIIVFINILNDLVKMWHFNFSWFY